MKKITIKLIVVALFVVNVLSAQSIELQDLELSSQTSNSSNKDFKVPEDAPTALTDEEKLVEEKLKLKEILKSDDPYAGYLSRKQELVISEIEYRISQAKLLEDAKAMVKSIVKADLTEDNLKDVKFNVKDTEKEGSIIINNIVFDANVKTFKGKVHMIQFFTNNDGLMSSSYKASVKKEINKLYASDKELRIEFDIIEEKVLGHLVSNYMRVNVIHTALYNELVNSLK